MNYYLYPVVTDHGVWYRGQHLDASHDRVYAPPNAHELQGKLSVTNVWLRNWCVVSIGGDA